MLSKYTVAYQKILLDIHKRCFFNTVESLQFILKFKMNFGLKTHIKTTKYFKMFSKKIIAAHKLFG